MTPRTSSRHTVLKRAVVLAASFGASFGAVVLAADGLDPWTVVADAFDLVLVTEDCQLSEAAAACLHDAERGPSERPHAVAVPTEIRGELSRRTCNDVRTALAVHGHWWARASLHTWSEAAWCRRLADGARAWLVATHGAEEWPAFVHERRLVGLGLRPESFVAVGEPEVGARLHACVDAFLARTRTERGPSIEAPAPVATTPPGGASP
jgi:hypothetical protein